MSNWTEEKINKLTGTRFTPAGYDFDGFDANGFNQWGYDAEGFNNKNMDKFGNFNGTELTGYMTTILIRTSRSGVENFTKGEIVPPFFPKADKQSRDRHHDYSASFEKLVKDGFIEKSGRRYIFTAKGVSKIAEVEALSK